MADWEMWPTQADVDGMVATKLNTIRIPLGFWIIEDIVDKSHEPYAEGGLDELVCIPAFVVAKAQYYTCTNSWSHHVQRWGVRRLSVYTRDTN